MSLLTIILAIFLPPVAVAMQRGITGAFWLNLLLTIIGWVPGVIHAFLTLR
uniref:YqaE/Pmp3 family membrane protein n=1 Tax=Roseihalotalea indica TaxID=2867963 RepID=A0AA49GPX2_9BACT|nr:YqaE/Pmp3 family membrane protein [Tunicatimonas sp. TK19036]